MELAQDKFSIIAYDEASGILTLTWSAATAMMTDEDFKAINLAYANYAEARQAQHLLVDVQQFRHHFGPELGAWRLQTIIPKYHRAGVRKMAFLHGSDFDESPPEMTGAGENFVTRHFAAEPKAKTWLLEA